MRRTPDIASTRTLSTLSALAALTGLLLAAASPALAKDDDEKLLSGMSIVGNDEAPKSLVIVPWKSSQLGDDVGLSRLLDDGMTPVDKDVFLRALDYYQIREAAE